MIGWLPMRLVGVLEVGFRGDSGVRERGVGASAGVPGYQPRGVVPVLHAHPDRSRVPHPGPRARPGGATRPVGGVVHAAVAGVRSGQGGRRAAGGGGTAGRTSESRCVADPFVRQAGADAHRASAIGGAVSGLANGERDGAEGARRVPVGACDGARFADTVVPAGM